MDWTKAKTILIIALLITNIFLGVIYVAAQIKQGAGEKILHRETIELLEKKQIQILTDLPLKHSKMAVLNIRYDRMDEDVLETVLKNQEGMGEDRSQNAFVEYADNFLNKCGILRENVVLDKVEIKGKKTRVTYKNVYEGFTISESYIKCTIENGFVTELNRYWLHPLEFGRTKKETMSASAALIHFMGKNEQTKGVCIEGMELVYWLDPSAYGMESTLYDTAFPAWKVTYNDGEVRYIPAYME